MTKCLTERYHFANIYERKEGVRTLAALFVGRGCDYTAKLIHAPAETRLNQRLRRGHDFHQSAVVEQQEIVGTQARRLEQIDLEGAALDVGDGDFFARCVGRNRGLRYR